MSFILCNFKSIVLYSQARGQDLVKRKGGKAMTDKQMQFIAWLITTATDKCKDMDEVHKMNEEIRKHSAGLTSEADGESKD